MRAIFLDKDGTLVDNVPHNVDPQRLSLCQGAIEGLRLFRQQGFRLFLITNQPGIAHGYFDEAALLSLFNYLSTLLQDQGVCIDGFYHCPHHVAGSVPAYAIPCTCRKPLPGMLMRAAREHGIDLQASWMIGDILHDVECGLRAGCRTVLVDNGNETEWEWSPLRMPHLAAPDLHSAARMVARFERQQQARLLPEDAS